MPPNSHSWERLLEVFSEALELPPGPERTRHLREMLSDDPFLLAEADAMLQAHGLEPLEVEKRLLTPTGNENDLSGALIGTYRLMRLIARGGMGEVYAAEREGGTFRQQVALKLLRHGLADAEARVRFGQERQILARLIHPLIVPLLDGGVTGDGRPYLVLQHVDGEPIAAYCRNQQCGLEERLRLLRDVARAVDYAHRNLIVHRDLKPSNILVTTDGQVRLLDFGVAKMLDAAVEEATPVTRTGMRIMTIDYATPEQVRGEAITTATDVYGLGVLLYELLVGQRPFSADAGGRNALERRILDQEPELPSVGAGRRMERWAGRLRGDLDTIVLKAMAKEPERRYSSAEELARDIERYLGGQPVVARKPSFSYRLGKFVRRNRLATAVTAISAMLLLVLTGMTFLQSRRVARERDRARVEQERANQVVALLVDLFSTANPENTPGGSDITIGEFLKRVEGTVVARKDTDPAVQAQLRQTLGKMYVARSQFAQARLHLEAALEQLRRLHGDRHADTAAALHDLVRLTARTGPPAAALPMTRQSLELHRELHGENHVTVAQCMQDLAALLNQPEQKLELLEKALAIRRRLTSVPNMGVAANLNELGIFHHGTGDMARAGQYFQESLDIVRRVAPKGHPAGLSLMANLAVIHQHYRRYEEAERLQRALLEDTRRLVGEESVGVGTAWGNLGTLLTQRGRHAEAEEAFRNALTVLRKSLGPGHSLVANAMRNLGVIRLLRGAPGESLPLLQGAVEISRKVHGTVPGYWGVVSQEAVAMAYAGRVNQALPRLRQAVEQLTQAANVPPLLRADARVRLAFVLLDAGNAAEAEGLFRGALEARRKRIPVDDNENAEAECGLGAALAGQGKPEGRELVRRSLPKFRVWGLANPYFVKIATRRHPAP